jgi:hypothetical protein
MQPQTVLLTNFNMLLILFFILIFLLILYLKYKQI